MSQNNNSPPRGPPPPPPPPPRNDTNNNTNNSNNNNINNPHPPPPPRMTPIAFATPPPPPPASSASSATSPPKSPSRRAQGDASAASSSLLLPPHSVSAAIPTFDSAPASSNLSFEELRSVASMASSDLLQGAVDFFNTATAATSSSTTTTPVPPRPLPPPPPPPPVLTHTSTTTTKQQQDNNTSPFQPTVAPLPPPPPAVVVSNNTAAATTTSPSSSSYVVRSSAPQKPNTTLPYTQFRPKQYPSNNHHALQLLSASQTSIPILLIATEHAHQMAWKNGLYLSDLLEGLVQHSNLSNTVSSSNSMLPPFRSATRSMALNWDDLATLTFTEPDKLSLSSSSKTVSSHEFSAKQLQQAVILQQSDGNLQHELAVLEDQIDNLLCDHDPATDESSSNNNNNNNNNSHIHTTSEPPNALTDPMGEYERIQRRQEQAVKDAFQLTSPLNIPWLWRYRQALDESTTTTTASGHAKIVQHELFACPAVILTICTTNEELNPIETAAILQSQHYLPGNYYRNGLFDPNSVRHEVLVLHDNVTGPKAWDESNLRNTLQRQFGSCSTILRINSIPPETAMQLAQEETSDLWGGGGKLGNCLSVGDRASLRKYLAQLLQSAVLPALERRIADLNSIVSDRKKGVKNVFKSFWGGGRVSHKKEDYITTDSSGGGGGATTSSSTSSMMGGGSSMDLTTSTDAKVLYRYDSIESQTRLLGDTLFLMKDYDAALSVYRLIKEDFKQDKAWTHYGSVQEMIALCMYFVDPYRYAKEIFSSIENALLSYSRGASDEWKQLEHAGLAGSGSDRATAMGGQRAKFAPLATRLATRLCLVLISTRSICSGRHMEVADLLASASSNETALGAAVLLEQSSAHYFHASMYRKYAFHMLMSGHMFRSAEQDHHAFRCFTSALYIYRDGKWEELHNHLRSALAAQLFSMGRMAVALQLYAKLLGSTEGGRVSVKSQQKFINNILLICNDHRKKALAGVDRMTAPSKLSGEQRDRVRKEHLDRVVQVIQFTKSASRELEIPNMDLPCIDDSTVTVVTEEANHHRQESLPSFGEAKFGSQEVWDELILRTIAELKASKMLDNDNSSIELAPTTKKALSKIEDDAVRRVLALIEREKVDRNILERTKRRGTFRETPPVRAQMEPIAVEFTISNPLSLPVDINDLQLVAKMKEEDGHRICTNEDAISIRPLASYDEKKKWTFQSSSVEFEIADFCRISSHTNSDQQKMTWKSAEDVEPFFVVNKSTMTLAPESKKTISALICPIARGDLHIVGIRCRLFDNVWVYHPFDIKGALLQNTRSNRANRVRGESLLLKAKVERGMPCLTVDLVSQQESTPSESSGPVLQAQVGKWALRVSNVGTAAASNITLKTNFPWMNIDGETRGRSSGNEKTRENKAVSCCIGPTGTLMQLPITNGNLREDGEIQPGESMIIPIEIRPSNAGKQDFYMLFRYELPTDSVETKKPRHRWLKKMFEVSVYPSLSLSASITPAFSAVGEHILALELTNCRTDRPDKQEIRLNNVTMASRHYRLEPLPGQIIVDAGSPFYLGWQERATIHYRILPQNDDEETPRLLSECSLINDDGNTAVDRHFTSSLLNFLCLERAHNHFEDCVNVYHMALARAAAQGDENGHPKSIASIRRANTMEASSASIAEGSEPYKVHPTSIERLCPKTQNAESVHIVCTWEDQSGTICGEHHIRGISVRPLTPSKGCPIVVTAEHPALISNDFSQGPAIVPLKINLRNRLATSQVDFEFAVEKPDTFDFTGPECHRAKLKSGEEMQIPLKALLPAAGVYNLQKVRVTVDAGEPTSYLFPSQWIVTANGA